MRRLIVGLALLSLVGCTRSTEYGDCVGLGSERDPKLVYKPKMMNVVMALVLVETVVVPIYVFLYDIECPVGDKDE